ncbi:hypothetical protein ABVK25_000959 [Lepraria finkii]|uniref:Uncharacterized protein n=1 Tax=Lepraria finkii TaxID=1340010 RepID=A0ABR4BPD8_9LECA
MAMVIATVNSLPSISNITLPQTLASLEQSLTSGLNLSANLTTSNAEAVIENCGEAFIDVRMRVSQARNIALRAYGDSHLGVTSAHGFRAMFKDRTAIAAVGTFLRNIYELRAKGGLNPHPGTYLEPRIACATENMAARYDYLHLGYDPWQRCLTHTPEGIFPPAFYAEGTAYIFLCPVYNIQAPIPLRSHCPSVVESDNVFVGNQNLFYRQYQVYTLIYYLTRFYLGDFALGANTHPREQIDWNDCVFNLNILESIRNPTNMQLYMARKSFPL